MAREDDFIVRMGYGITIDPYSLARPMRTNYPLLVVLNVSGSEHVPTRGTVLSDGIPLIPEPDLGNGIIDIGSQVAANSLEKNYQRGYVQSWNFTVQKSLPWRFDGTGRLCSDAADQPGRLSRTERRADQRRHCGARSWRGVRTDGRDAAGDADRQLALRQLAGVVRTAVRGRLATAAYPTRGRRASGFAVARIATGCRRFSCPSSTHLNRARHRQQRAAQFSNDVGLGTAVRPRKEVCERRAARRRGSPAGGRSTAILSALRVSVLRDFGEHVLNALGTTQRADQVKDKVEILGGAGRGQSYFDPFASPR